MSNAYQNLDICALQVLMDYTSGCFPIDLIKLCESLKIKLIKYSQLPKEKLYLINNIARFNELKDGFSIILNKLDSDGYIAYTYYNDNYRYDYEIKRSYFTIAHEIKHILYNETNPSLKEETEADHFARVLMCPPCILIAKKYATPQDIAKDFGLTKSASINAFNSINNRIKVYGDKLFKYELNFLNWYKKSCGNKNKTPH